MVTEKMREAGSQIASDLMDAQVSFHMEGLGGSKDWEEFQSFHDGKNMDLINSYVNGEIDSVTAIYIAMHRESMSEEISDEPQVGSPLAGSVSDVIEGDYFVCDWCCKIVHDKEPHECRRLGFCDEECAQEWAWAR